MFVRMTTRALYRQFIQDLQSLYSLNEATIITDWTFESIAGVQKADFIKTPGDILPDHLSQQLNTALSDLLESKPIQYVLGEAYFFKMKLAVNEHVLIPRPETEELVQLVIDDCQREQTGKEIAIIDIGTGSGCIAIALKKNISSAELTAIDVSAPALKLAEKNAQDQAVIIGFTQIDFLSVDEREPLQRFDVIVSNPPYIPLNEKEKLDKNVTAFEPATALFVPANDPLLFYREIASFGKTHLTEQGKIFVEIHENFASEVLSLFQETYARVSIHNDLFGRPRMVTVSNKG
ncbi:MAG: peptide chain release factor N(5)-glutamine methyltransferase [Ferruginibacter sp.]|nr:peptide chain release factor N(5)-glutamine methyltransferase [Ferruginibacter sp.]